MHFLLPMLLSISPATVWATSTANSVIQSPNPAASREPAWTAHVDPAGQIFPSMIIAMATAKSDQSPPLDPDSEEAKKDAKVQQQTLGDPDGWLYVLIKSPKAGTRVRVAIECPEIMDTSSFKGVLDTEGATYGIAPKVRWKYKDLAKVRQPLPVNIIFKVTLDDNEADEDVKVCTLHTINDCPFLHIERDENADTATIHNLGFLFASYVNEDHPWVDKILKQALESKTVENFVGYQANSEDEVLKQVYAVWNVLQQRGITYSDITKVSTRNDRVPSQHVRFLDESFEMKQANCVDGSVLVASVLRKIGIDTFLMITPNHCYIGFFTDAKREKMAGLETTMMGQAKKETFDRTKNLRALLDDNKTFDEASWESFEAALSVGTKNLEEHSQKMLDGEFRYLQVIIKDAREQGIKAIPYFPPDKKETLPGAPAELTPEQLAERKREDELRRKLHDDLEKLKIPDAVKVPNTK